LKITFFAPIIITSILSDNCIRYMTLNGRLTMNDEFGGRGMDWSNHGL